MAKNAVPRLFVLSTETKRALGIREAGDPKDAQIESNCLHTMACATASLYHQSAPRLLRNAAGHSSRLNDWSGLDAFMRVVLRSTVRCSFTSACRVHGSPNV